MNSKTRCVPPKAGAMLESLRGLGYSTATALADIVDNSISAGARKIKINFHWENECSHISIIDNGSGMNNAELENAMTLGAVSPLNARSSNDLGRFGMGLKTASFSQCRRLTVVSKRKGSEPNCLRWDLDALESSSSNWVMFEGPEAGSEKHIKLINSVESGTQVLWENLDRIISTGYEKSHFSDLIDDVELWLSMVFHRFIEGTSPALVIYINDKIINPWDPFMLGHPAKPWHSPIASINTEYGKVDVECHVLPHKDRLTDAEYSLAGGRDGWTAHQGFYVYRNKRLLMAGDWLGLGRGKAWNREEAHKLARIRVDIHNTADNDWKIDIRKSTAKPPVILRPWLTKFAEDTRDRARKVFSYRGTKSTNNSLLARVEHVWRVEHLRGGVKYRIDENHPAISTVLDAVGEQARLVRTMFRIIEETVPVQRIWLDAAENEEIPRTNFSGIPEKASGGVMEVLVTLFKDMIERRGMSQETASKILSSTEPFQNYPDLIKSLSGKTVINGD